MVRAGVSGSGPPLSTTVKAEGVVDHYLIESIEKALGWNGPRLLGQQFPRGSMVDHDLCSRLLTPTKLLDVVMRRSLPRHSFAASGTARSCIRTTTSRRW